MLQTTKILYQRLFREKALCHYILQKVFSNIFYLDNNAEEKIVLDYSGFLLNAFSKK